MRTVFVEHLNDPNLQEYVVINDDAFHLLKVVRVKLGEKIQIINGQGLLYNSEVKALSKNEVKLNITSCVYKKKSHRISLLCGQPKKSTCEEIIRLGVELGLESIVFWNSEFSQEGTFSEERLKQIIKNAMEQSNNLWQPTLSFIQDLTSSDHLKTFQNGEKIIFHNQILNDETQTQIACNLSETILMIIGPEGGLSKNDLSVLENFYLDIKYIVLPSPILTTPTAISCGAGYLFSVASK